MTLFSQEQRGQGGVPGALPLPVPWTLLSCPSYQGPGQAHYLSQGHVVVANYPYVVCATIISMRLSAEQTQRDYTCPVEKSGFKAKNSGSRPNSS